MSGPDDALVAEVARLRAAADTLDAIERACVDGIPRTGHFVAVSVIVAAYLDAAPYPSPMRTVP